VNEEKDRNMVRNSMVAVVSLGVALSGCSKSPSVTAQNASVGEVAEKVAEVQAGGQFISPGRWESTMTIREMTVPGLPPEMAERMKAHMGQAKSFISCLTPEEVKQPEEGFFGGANSGCRYERFSMADGKIDGVMKCSGQGMERTMAMSGNYSPDTYNMAVSSEGKGQGPAAMTMKMTLEAKRTGACTGKEEQ
jgi:Protein of unknown function (DUF3617)